MATIEDAAHDERDQSRRLVRRRALKAGTVLIPTIFTLRGRTTSAQTGGSKNKSTGRLTKYK